MDCCGLLDACMHVLLHGWCCRTQRKRIQWPWAPPARFLLVRTLKQRKKQQGDCAINSTWSCFLDVTQAEMKELGYSISSIFTTVQRLLSQLSRYRLQAYFVPSTQEGTSTGVWIWLFWWLYALRAEEPHAVLSERVGSSTHAYINVSLMNLLSVYSANLMYYTVFASLYLSAPNCNTIYLKRIDPMTESLWIHHYSWCILYQYHNTSMLVTTNLKSDSNIFALSPSQVPPPFRYGWGTLLNWPTTTLQQTPHTATLFLIATFSSFWNISGTSLAGVNYYPWSIKKQKLTIGYTRIMYENNREY